MFCLLYSSLKASPLLSENNNLYHEQEIHKAPHVLSLDLENNCTLTFIPV